MSSNCSRTDPSSTTFTCGNRIGLTFIAQAACLSFTAVVVLLTYVTYKAFRHRGKGRWRFFNSHLDLYLMGLLVSDLIQSIGGIMDIQWIVDSGVGEGHFCTAQGVLEQFGDVGVALCSLAIAVHTFAEIVLRWEEPSSFLLPRIVLGLYVVFLTLIVGVGYAMHRNCNYYGNTTYWCWIRKDFLGDGIGLEYAWLWLAALVNLLLYVPVFLALNRVIIVEGRGLKCRVRRTTPDEKRIPPTVDPRRMLFYPAVYIVTVLPIAIVRIHSFVSNAFPFPATVISGVLFSSSGLFNVLVYTGTRPGLLQPSTAAAEPVMRPRIFGSDDDISDGGRPSAMGERKHDGPRLADSTFETDDVPRPGRQDDARDARDPADDELPT